MSIGNAITKLTCFGPEAWVADRREKKRERDSTRKTRRIARKRRGWEHVGTVIKRR